MPMLLNTGFYCLAWLAVMMASTRAVIATTRVVDADIWRSRDAHPITHMCVFVSTITAFLIVAGFGF